MISMKISAAWEAEKSSSSAIQRICHIQIAQIILDRQIDSENATTGIHVAVRMRGNARRILRSPEISLVAPQSPVVVPPKAQLPPPPNLASYTSGYLMPSTSRGAGGSILINLNCSIQYSHLLKMDANILQILLQRRKKYKNTTMNLGYKTLAYCNINLSQVLQWRIENRFLDMFSDPKCLGIPVGSIEVQCLSTVPLERDITSGAGGIKGDLDMDGEEQHEFPLRDAFSDPEDSDRVDVDSDEEVTCDDGESGINKKKLLKSMSVGQIKQKVMRLLKRLKLFDPNDDIDTCTTSHLWDEIDKMEAVSDVEEEDDSDLDGTESVSFHSVPRPSIRPFFGHTASSEETLSVDAGARLLRRLQKEADSQHQSTTSSQPPISCEQSNILQHQTPPSQSAPQEIGSTRGDVGPRRRGTGVKFPGMKRRIPSGVAAATNKARTQLTHTTSNLSPILPPVKESKYLNDKASTEMPTKIDLDEPYFNFYSCEPTILPASLNDVQFIVNNLEPSGRLAAMALSQARCSKLVRVASYSEVKQFMGQLVSWTQMQGNRMNRSHRRRQHLTTADEYHQDAVAGQPPVKDEDDALVMRVCVVGGDVLLNSVLRAYVEAVGSKPEAVAAAFRFYLVPVSGLMAIPSLSDDKASTSQTIGDYSRLSWSSFPSDIKKSSTSGPSILPHPFPRESGTGLPEKPDLYTSNLIAQRLCCLDSRYFRLFGDLAQGIMLAMPTSLPPCKSDIPLIATTPLKQSAQGSLLPLPIGECLVAGVASRSGQRCSSSNPFSLLSSSPPDGIGCPPVSTNANDGVGFEEESGQVFVPFLLCIGLGSEAILPSCLHSMIVSSTGDKLDDIGSCPPSSLEPNEQSSHPPGAPHLAPPPTRHQIGCERTTYELQLEYWNSTLQTSSTSSTTGVPLSSLGGVGLGGCSNSQGFSTSTDRNSALRPVTSKVTCRSMVVALGNNPNSATHCQQKLATPQKASLAYQPQLNLALLTREKKPKIMRIGKRTKEVLFKPEVVECVTRLICTCKGITHTAVETLRLGHSISMSESPGNLAPSATSMNTNSSSAAANAAHMGRSESFAPVVMHRLPSRGTESKGAAFEDVSASPIITFGSNDHCSVKVNIDGVEWPTAKFFQVAPGWRTHVKSFPLISLSTLTPAQQLSAFPLPFINLSPPIPHSTIVTNSSSVVNLPS